MLKITTLREGNTAARVALCGEFTEEYVAELKRTLDAECAGCPSVAVDLSGVTFVDRGAMSFLCTAKSQNVSIENVPSYVYRWIEQERRCGPASKDSKD